MAEQTYALIVNGVVQQLLSTDQDIANLFAAGLQWVPVANPAGVAAGDLFDGTNFTAPAAPVAPAPVVTLADLEAQLASLQTAIAALSAGH